MKHWFPGVLAVSLALLSAGCVDLPPGTVPAETSTTSITPSNTFPGLDPGAKDFSGLHFEVHAYGSDKAQQFLDMAETQYNQIMTDTDLYSFMPPSAGLYSIVVYGSRDEYLTKTGQPAWSGGMTYGNAIYSYESSQLPMILAHEMVHLLFHEYMGTDRPDLRWLNEGLAVYEENVRVTVLGFIQTGTSEVRRAMAQQSIPFDQMANPVLPPSEQNRGVNLWYQQVGSVVGFMIERGGHNGFYQFLSTLRNGRDLETAIHQGFPNLWSSRSDLEAAWKRSL